AQETDLVSLLPADAAQRWACHLLLPLMGGTVECEKMWATLPTALAYPYTVAGPLLGLHRNTISQRVARAGELLRMDLTVLTHRVAVALALDVVSQREATTVPPKDAPATNLKVLLAAPQVGIWAESLLRFARGDRRDLIRTATCWIAHDAHYERAARALGLSEVTVRSHTRALEEYMSRDLSTLSGLRDLHCALFALTGAPPVSQPGALHAAA
ncbi:helix-turn-helix domain-containing protein, partial [Streptomyces formicae]